MEEKNILKKEAKFSAPAIEPEIESIFVDTNILMHCLPLEKIPLKSFVKSDNIEIVFTRFNIIELNKNKDNPQQKKILRDRAKKQLDIIDSLFTTGNTGTLNGYSVKMLLSDTRPEDYGLCSITQDNIQIANILKYKSEGHNVYFFTNDTGAKICARSYGIACHNLSDYLLPEEDDPETIELKQLKKELFELKNRRPVLGIVDFERLSNDVVFQNVKINLSLHPKKEFPRYENPTSPLNFNDSLGLPSIIRLSSINEIYDKSELERWEKAVKKYNKDYDEYEKEVSSMLSLRISKISICLKNSGTFKASHIVLKLIFPDDLTVFDSIEDFERIKPPKAPIPPKKRNDFLTYSMPTDLIDIQCPKTLIALNYSLEKQNKHFVFKECFAYLLQNTQEKIHELFIINPPNGFTVSYELIAEELPKPLQGQLQMHH